MPSPGEVHVLERDGGDAAGSLQRYSRLRSRRVRPAGTTLPRVVPWHPGAQVPLECDHILWYR